ncbi:single-stranded-DNA-specific exonuclease RecJ [Candidatus Curtissbacteria bacterium RBG_13_40_7]|uniref:Single-stranded-DNA-specific exonuclease RecJ n=1 Tax=Candidatus Curtissbacteria bacterium RBG_13_40_7 TaxID=1797706 RepID=A0A1F5FWS2_9BACT|nr:MAG: single-stranded-DNA-specific exonuclease RecJ [Candidatus Curtissbacteria bacterium RBG_13_40_7]
MAQYAWNVISRPDHKKKNWLASILAKNRKLDTKKKFDEFLHPSLKQILEVKPTGISKAIGRIQKALAGEEKIVVYSDYDADGICGTAILWETLYDLEASVLPYVPHRIKEGYGLSNEAIAQLAKEGVGLILTVDHGVAAFEQITHASDLGVDVIVTDHHILPKKLPKAQAIVHSTDLCGAGVSWHLAFEIVKKLKPSYKECIFEKLELAALATIADLVPLLGANRAIVKLGLERLSQTKRPGILALMKAAALGPKIGTYEIGHILAPRINAMGRIEHALDSLRLLCAKNQEQADKLAQLLCKTNTKRQSLTTKTVASAISMVSEDQLIGVIANDNWHEGIIGLVASRMVDSFHKPMIVISKGEVYSKGSARSIPGFNIAEAISTSSEFVIEGGGHPMAAGFTIKTCHIQNFSESINEYAKERLAEELLIPKLSIECELVAEDINHKTLEIINEFEPFGMANPQPLFLTRNMLVEDVRCVGAASDHLKLQLSGLSAIGFNMGKMRTEIRPGYSVDAVYSISEDRYNGNDAIQLKLKDLSINSN